ncbi:MULTISPECIES: hypothetical protein [unclassified Streptomyces]|jgi:hypothetical protein|uniref:hypothetical protein n=1 Tax=unclassified Streptomyces TaxID=2593676 RepID=UPI002E2C28E7|nr:hypothetical protein [Streptomyces sp. NBC_00299]
MLLLQVSRGLFELALGMQAQTKLGGVGVLLLLAVGVGIRARRAGLAVGAAMVFTLLMIQA